jgi:hypothetical protein
MDQSGDPQRHPHGVPANLGPALIPIIAGAPRALSVSQRVEHGAIESRSERFADAVNGALDVNDALAADFLWRTWSDRRHEGRRYRGTDFIRDLDGPQEPYEKGHQADIPLERYKTY